MRAIGKPVLIAALLFMHSACRLQSAADVESKAKEPQNQSEILAQLPNDPTKAFVNLVTVKIKSDLLTAFLDELAGYAAITRKEPGVIEYRIHQSPNDPNVVVLYEFYKNTSAREKHNASEHRNRFFTAVREKGYFAVPAVSVTLYPIGSTDGGK
jgi:quinol monooxygenase YgiN